MPVLTVDEAGTFVEAQRNARKKIVFTNGVFDLLHVGHTRYLRTARQLGGTLLVGVNSDSSVRRLGKGDGRPVTPETERAELLASLAFVDAVVIFDEDTPEKLIARLLPDILVKGSDWKDRENPGRKLIEDRGGTMVFVPLEGGYSTTSILERIKKSRG
ncbi:MAG TPA: D-glycero-beta-D-manno-heptose 1-phosphate adenylyltransferase [Vicinamibacterales bacterium]|nr:D-glycero-beta-D-manno-heptose 1-phosphate adenylyltransferase [Vicinamibacterales bacterium]